MAKSPEAKTRRARLEPRLPVEPQSSNVELGSLKDELHTRNADLVQLTEDCSLVAGADIPILILDGDRRLRRFTPAAGKVFNLVAADLGRTFKDVALRLDPTDWDDLISEAMGGRGVVEREVRDAQGHWYGLRLRHYQTGEEQADGTLVVLYDIDSLKRRLDESRERELLIQDAASQAILSVDADGRIVMANRTAETMFGYTREELMELPVEYLLPERLRDAHRAHRAQYAQTPQTPQTRYMGPALALKGLRKTGAEFPIATILNHIHTRDGILALDFITDLSETQEAEEALRESQARFALFMGHLPAGAFLKDLQGRYVYVNPGFEKLMGRAPGECLGAVDEDYWPNSAPRLREQDQAVIRTGRALALEDTCTSGPKARHFQTVKFPIPDKNGMTVMVAGFIQDVTGKKHAEQERESLRAILATAQEEERRRISRELHDDLTQRLAGLAIDLGSLAEKSAGLSMLRKKDLRALQRRVAQAAEVTRHLAHELHPSELDDLGLAAVLRSYCEDFGRRENLEIEFVCRNAPRELKREIASCLYKVTQESLRNISKHAGAKAVSVILDTTEDWMRLMVKDAGVGFRAQSPATNVGLGLVSMKERVQLLRGSFTISSQPGRGTEIVVEIPLEVL